jgi:hypothetical protein
VDRHAVASWAALTALGANAAWALALVYLHLVERSMDPSRRFVSEYVLTGSAWAMHLAFASMAFVGASLAVALASTGWRGVPVALVLAAYAASMAIAGWFPTDPSTSTLPLSRAGEWHNEAARYAFLALVGAAVIAIALAITSSSRDARWLLASLALLVGYGFARYGMDVAGPGIAQRVFLASAWVWFAVSALRVLDEVD